MWRRYCWTKPNVTVAACASLFVPMPSSSSRAIMLGLSILTLAWSAELVREIVPRRRSRSTWASAAPRQSFWEQFAARNPIAAVPASRPVASEKSSLLAQNRCVAGNAHLETRHCLWSAGVASWTTPTGGRGGGIVNGHRRWRSVNRRRSRVISNRPQSARLAASHANRQHPNGGHEHQILHDGYSFPSKKLPL
jgi:hypothetical protein